MHNKKTPALVSINTALTEYSFTNSPPAHNTAIKHSEQAAAIQASGQVWDAGERGRRGRMRATAGCPGRGLSQEPRAGEGLQQSGHNLEG